MVDLKQCETAAHKYQSFIFRKKSSREIKAQPYLWVTGFFPQKNIWIIWFCYAVQFIPHKFRFHFIEIYHKIPDKKSRLYTVSQRPYYCVDRNRQNTFSYPDRDNFPIWERPFTTNDSGILFLDSIQLKRKLSSTWLSFCRLYIGVEKGKAPLKNIPVCQQQISSINNNNNLVSTFPYHRYTQCLSV